MKKVFFQTQDNWTLTFQRIILGMVLFCHGLQKSFGLFGGYGFKGTMKYFTQSVGMPYVLGLLVILIEVVGSLCLLLGLATRLWSALMTGLFAGIIITVHWSNGFFMNWFGNLKGEGYEYFLLAIALSVSLLFNGGGRYSLDSLFAASFTGAPSKRSKALKPETL